MNATYYSIYEYSDLTCLRGEIVDEGIIRDSEDTIYPAQHTGNSDLPYECEAHKFSAKGYQIELIPVYLTREEILKHTL